MAGKAVSGMKARFKLHVEDNGILKMYPLTEYTALL